jgi:hypothetical protein
MDIVNIRTYLHDPAISSDFERGVNEAVAIECLATTRQGSALDLQTMQTLLVLAIDHARAPDGQAAYGEGQKGGQHVEKWLAFWFGSNLQRPHLPKHSNKPKLQLRFPSGPVGQFLVFLLPPTCIGAMLCKNTKRDMRHSTIELPQSIGKLGKDTYLRLGVDRFFDIGHGHTWSSHHFPSFYLQPVPVQFGISPPKRASQRPRAYCTDTVQYQNQIPVTGVK